MKINNIKKNRFTPLVSTALIILLAMAGCGASSMSKDEAFNGQMSSTEMAAPMMDSARYDAVQNEGSYEYDDIEMEEDIADYSDEGAAESTSVFSGGDNATPSANTAAQPRKRIVTVDLELQTKDFDTASDSIPKIAEELGGYDENSYVQGKDLNMKYQSRHASYTIRVPADQTNAFTDRVAEICHVQSENKNTADITSQYYDSEARLNSLKIRLDSLNKMKQSFVDYSELKYLLEVDREIANVIYEIDSITASLNRMKDSVGMSTINIQLREVTDYVDDTPVAQPITFGDRVRQTFGGSMDAFVSFAQGLALFAIALIPFLPVFIIIAVVIFIIVRKTKRNKANKSVYPAVPYIMDAQTKSQNSETPTEDNDDKE